MNLFITTIPLENLFLYQENDWFIHSRLAVGDTRMGNVVVAKETALPSNCQWMCDPKRINLIGGKINRPLFKFKDDRIFDAVTFPPTANSDLVLTSLIRIKETHFAYTVTKQRQIFAIDETGEKKFAIHVYHRLTDKEFNEYCDNLKLLRFKTGSVGFSINESPTIERQIADFWWDIENDVLLSFDRYFMSSIGEHFK